MSISEKLELAPNGGITKQIIKEGEGTETPTYGQRVSLHYAGRLMDGTEFDSTIKRNAPFEFVVGKGSVIEAFERCVKSMKRREKCILTCKPEFAYGAAGSPPVIPPNADLIFEMEILNWKPEDVSDELDGSILRYIIEPSDKRRKPRWESLVRVQLSGIYNDRTFEERDVLFNYGEGSEYNILKGVEKAIGKMRLGEKSRFYIKAKHAFGSTGNEEFGIPPNADVIYIIKLCECEKAADEWKWSDEERLEHARLYKERGTIYFRKNNYNMAITLYEKALAVLEPVNVEESTSLKIAAYNNCALCHQKLNNQFEGKKACNEVLKIDANNVKALFRRGQCNLATSDLVEALEDFRKVISLDMENKAALAQISVCKSKIRESNAREKKMYGNLFDRMTVTSDEPIHTPSGDDVLSKCGEWTDDDTRYEAELAFERDHIVMI